MAIKHSLIPRLKPYYSFQKISWCKFQEWTWNLELHHLVLSLMALRTLWNESACFLLGWKSLVCCTYIVPPQRTSLSTPYPHGFKSLSWQSPIVRNSVLKLEFGWLATHTSKHLDQWLWEHSVVTKAKLSVRMGLESYGVTRGGTSTSQKARSTRWLKQQPLALNRIFGCYCEHWCLHLHTKAQWAILKQP